MNAQAAAAKEEEFQTEFQTDCTEGLAVWFSQV